MCWYVTNSALCISFRRAFHLNLTPFFISLLFLFLPKIISQFLAHICSKNILHQIGGTDGQNLPDLSLKQLLDLVAWVETFRATIYEIFPILSKVTASIRSYEDNAPKLLMEDSKTIDVALAEDSLVWVNNTLWDIHNMAKDEFLFKTKEMAEVWLERGYRFVHRIKIFVTSHLRLYSF